MADVEAQMGQDFAGENDARSQAGGILAEQPTESPPGGSPIHHRDHTVGEQHLLQLKQRAIIITASNLE